MSAPYPTYEQEEAIAAREEDHDDERYAECIRCGAIGNPDDLVHGICPPCMRSAGLVECCGCGRAIHTTVAYSEEYGVGHKFSMRFCPPCHRESKLAEAVGNGDDMMDKLSKGKI